MKITKKIAALMLVLAMTTTTFTACGSGGTESTTSGGESSTAQSEASAGETTQEDDGTIHPVRIVQPGVLPAQYEEGIAAVNEKLAADGVNVEVSVQRIPWDSYDQKLNLMLTTGEEFEILHVMQDVKNLSAIAGMDAVISLDQYLEKYPDLVSKFTDLEWQGTLYNGERYAVPASWRTFDNTMSYMEARTDVMDKLGYDEFPSENVDDLITMMKEMQDYILDETGIKAYNWFHQNQDTAHWLHRTYDTYPFYVENSLGIVLIRQDGTVDSFYESEEFKNDANTYYKMYQEGLINPDILNLDSQVKYDQAGLGAFLPSQTFDPYTAVTIMNNTGMEGVQVDTYKMCPEKPEMIYTFVQNLNAISSTAENPESGLKFLNWLYESQENHDLFHYGIEGTHYTAVGDDKMEQMKGEDGQPLYQMDTWMTGYLPYMRFNADAPDSHIEYMTYKSDNYVVSPAAGFIFDSSNVATELTNLQTEIIASIYPIKMGMVPYEENIGPAIEKLKAAGLDKYLEEYRTQFAAYLEEHPEALEMAQGSGAESGAAESSETESSAVESSEVESSVSSAAE